MTFIEQACHRRATELWQQRPSLQTWRTRVFDQVLRYCEFSAERPTSSASILIFTSVAAAGAEAYRRKTPALTEWKDTLASEPQFLKRKMSEFYTEAGKEVRLHQDIVARLVKLA